MNRIDWLIILIIGLITGSTILLRKLTIAGALTGGCLAWLLYKGCGITGLAMLAAFFIGGTVATSIGARRKEQLGVAEHHAGQRTAGQVLANGGIAGLAGLLGWLQPAQSVLWQLVAASALASAAADTLSSELGTVYGKRFYNVLGFKRDKPGLDGVVSIEGTLCGIAASVMIAAIYSAGYGLGIHGLWIVIAGTVGNLADSVLGAGPERKGWLTNDLVNGLNTLAAAIIGLGCYCLF